MFTKMKINTNTEKAQLLRDITAMELGFTCDIERIHGTRSLSQNSALHASLRELATMLNESGLDQRKVLKSSIDIPWDEKSAKTALFVPIMVLMTGKESTTELDKAEMSEVWNTLMKHLGEKFGIYVRFGND